MIKKLKDLSIQLSNSIVYIVCVILLMLFIFFTIDQIRTNNTLMNAVQAVETIATESVYQSSEVTQSSTWDSVNYASAIAYIEAVQEAYGESSSMKIVSLIYALATTVVLSYGTTLLRLNKSEKDELSNEIYKRTEEKFEEHSNKLLKQQSELLESNSTELIKQQKESLEKQDRVLSATASCRNAIHLCFLLQVHIEMLEAMGKLNDKSQETRRTLDRLEVELFHSLQIFSDFVEDYSGRIHDKTLDASQVEYVRTTWIRTQDSLSGYIKPIKNASKSSQSKVFSYYDCITIIRLIDHIRDNVDEL